jgi:hypothetical protein
MTCEQRVKHNKQKAAEEQKAEEPGPLTTAEYYASYAKKEEDRIKYLERLERIRDPSQF